MRRLCCLLMILMSSTALAGELGIYACPSNDPDVTHYRVYTTGVLSSTAPLATLETAQGKQSDCDGGGTPDDPIIGVVVPVLDNCTAQNYTARWAVEGPPGVFVESGDSVQVLSIARPEINSINAGAAGVRQIMGDNFTASAIVTKVDGTVIPSVFKSCQVIDIQDTATRKLIVDTGLLPVTFTFPIEEPQGVQGF